MDFIHYFLKTTLHGLEAIVSEAFSKTLLKMRYDFSFRDLMSVNYNFLVFYYFYAKLLGDMLGGGHDVGTDGI